MKRKKPDYSQISNIRDLNRYKAYLRKRMKIRKLLMDKHIRDFTDDVSADYIYKQTLRVLKIENPFMKLMPSIVKQSGTKGTIAILSTLGAAVGAFFLFNKNKK